MANTENMHTMPTDVNRVTQLPHTGDITPTSGDKPVSAPKPKATDWAQLASDIRAKYTSKWAKPKLLKSTAAIGMQWLKVTSQGGYTSKKHAELYSAKKSPSYKVDGDPAKNQSKVLATACGIANTIGGTVETKGKGKSFAARIVGFKANELPPKAS